MLPRTHIIINLFLSLIFSFKIPFLGIVIFFLSSILIDIDHYIYYIIKKKDFNIKNSYKYFIKRELKLKKLSDKELKKLKHPILFLHGIEPLLVIYFLSLSYPILVYVYLGFFIHLIEDLIHEKKAYLTKLRFFLIYSIYDYKKK